VDVGAVVSWKYSHLPSGETAGGAAMIAADELDAFAAVARVHEQATAAPRRRADVLTAHDDETPVGRPRRLGGTDVAIHRHGARVGAVGVHQPQVVLAATVGDEGDGAPIGREPRLEVQRQARVLREALGASTGGRHAIDVAEQIEDDPATVGRDVHRHPRALRGLERDVAGRAACQRRIPRVGRRGRGLARLCE
jgi:hypothetical protein